MKILFTGGSSFTGFWFIRELAAAGHEVTAVFRKCAEEYSDEIRRQRVTIASRLCRSVHGSSFGEASFLTLVGRRKVGLVLPPRRLCDQLQEPWLRYDRRRSE